MGLRRKADSDEEQHSYASAFTVKVEGKDLDTALEKNLTEIIVDHTLYLPDMVVLHIDDTTRAAMDNTKLFDVGKGIEVQAYGTSIFKGEITSLESDFGEDGAAIFLVRGYDKSHRLHRGRKLLQKCWSELAIRIILLTFPQCQVAAAMASQDLCDFPNPCLLHLIRCRRVGYAVLGKCGPRCQGNKQTEGHDQKN